MRTRERLPCGRVSQKVITPGASHRDGGGGAKHMPRFASDKEARGQPRATVAGGSGSPKVQGTP